MPRTLGRKGAAVSVALLTAISVFCVGGVALADNIQDSIEAPGASVALVAGSATTGTASIKVVGNSSGGDIDDGCNIDAGEAPLVLTIHTPTGVTASPNPLTLTSCGTDVPVTFTAASNAESGIVTTTVFSGPAGGGSYKEQVSIPITITQPVVTNTKPSVAVAGVTNGASYEIGSVPAATCEITDAEDGNSSAPAVITGTLTNGMGSLTATCDYTDGGGLSADTATATYSVVDTTDPTITYTLSPWPNGDTGWYTSEVVVDFICEDFGSGIASCEGDTTLGDGANQSVTGTATDNAGNTATATASGINIDTTAPDVALVGGPVGSYYFGSLPDAPECEGSDALSGLATCDISGGGSAVGGPYTYTATATDNAGNTSSVSQSYSVLAWNLSGFYSPVDMGNVWNTVKGGSTVPLKFEIFAGSTEKTNVDAVQSFTYKYVTCPGSSVATDDIEVLATGGTTLRYDATGGQFIQNWSTPKKPGTCVVVTMTTDDGSSISANFKLK